MIFKMSLSCRTLMISSSHSKILFKFVLYIYIYKGTTKKLRTLRNLSLKKNHEGLKVDWGVWIHWSWHQEECRHWLKAAATSATGLGSMNMLSAWFLPVIIRDLVIIICILRYQIWWSRWSAYSSGGKAYYLNCHFFVISYFLYIFHKCDYIFLLGKIDCLEPPSSFWHCIYGKVCPYTVFTNVTSLGTTHFMTLGNDCIWNGHDISKSLTKIQLPEQILK